MKKLSGKSGKTPVCAAAQFAWQVDEQLNSAAIREFREATSETQESGADLGEGSAYLDYTPASFAPKSVVCGMCHAMVSLSDKGFITADLCLISGFCEFEWVTKYPDKYRTESGDVIADELVCRVEIGCRALIGLVKGADGIPTPSIIDGECEVAIRGDDWVKRRNDELNAAKLFDPDAGIEQFDGRGSGREGG